MAMPLKYRPSGMPRASSGKHMYPRHTGTGQATGIAKAADRVRDRNILENSGEGRVEGNAGVQERRAHESFTAAVTEREVERAGQEGRAQCLEG